MHVRCSVRQCWPGSWRCGLPRSGASHASEVVGGSPASKAKAFPILEAKSFTACGLLNIAREREDAISLRTYSDSSGRSWLVWSVIPHFEHPRSGEERRQTQQNGLPADRRNGEDRRGPLPEWANGWLCFESSGEIRRLSPVPPDWTQCAPEKLERYRTHASVATR